MSRESQEILKKIESLSSADPFVLAMVVDVRGSSYRLPGAKMLIDERGETIGTVSGGCLETDVLERAHRVRQTGVAEVFTYDMTAAPDDSIFSLNMGCRGVIRILLERVKIDAINFYRRLNDARRAGVAATLIAANAAAKNSAEYKIGGRLLLDGETIVPSDFDGRMQEELIPACLEVLREEKSKTLAVGEHEFFLEFIAPPLSLLVFGAGADAVPLALIGANLGWQISVFDHRPAFLTADRFSEAKNLILYNAENLADKIQTDHRTAAIVMTHNYDRDREILRYLLGSDAFYVGALGPKRRADDLLGELKESGGNFDDRQLGKLFAPVGLRIGADAPETIALSIAAKIQTVLRGETGGSLRDKNGSIYQH